MKRTFIRRLGAAILVPTLAFGTLAATGQAAHADPNTEEASAAEWLVNQPKISGLFPSYYGTGRDDFFIDYGLNLDIYVALDKFDKDSAAEKVFAASIEGADDYTDAFGTRYAGAMGKLAAMVQHHGDDASSVGGRNLITETEALVSTEGTSAGRAIDGDLGSPFYSDSSNTIGQGWVVRALGNASSSLASSTVAYLLKQQCDDDSFRVQMSDEQCTTGSGSVDATAFAVLALDAVGGYEEEADDAAAWLQSIQQQDGSFGDQGSSNTNSTGLAAVVLGTHDYATEAAFGAGWVAAHQVPSGDEEGAIALNDADFTSASAAPIARVDRDRYVRASVQAALSLEFLQGAASFAVTAPTDYVSAGSSIDVTATGLDAFEPFTVRVGSASPVYGTASATGEVSTSAPTPGGTADRDVVVTGTNASRSGVATVDVLAAKTFKPKVKKSSLKIKKTQTMTVAGLAPNEPVRVVYRGDTVKSGTATASGTFKAKFKVGKSKGKKKVVVRGAFGNRKGVKKFLVK